MVAMVRGHIIPLIIAKENACATLLKVLGLVGFDKTIEKGFHR